MSEADRSASHVVVYASPSCAYCAAAKRLLRRKRADFLEINVPSNPQRRQQMIELSGRQTVPQIFIGGRHIGGYTELAALESEGRLEALLAEDV